MNTVSAETRRCVLAQLIPFLALLLAACATVHFPARIVVEWTTASEINTAGFNLYRSDEFAGTYVKLNAELIRGARDPIRGGTYRYEDYAITPGKTYYYKLEDVELTGATTQHEPIPAPAPAMDAALGLGAGALGATGIVAFLARRKRR